jgi:predicted MarR family transcription regulator
MTPAILAALRAADKAGRVLSVREIQAACHISSTSVVLYHLRRMERDGLLTFGARGHSRSYRLTPAGRGYPSDTELLARCLAYVPPGELADALEARLR